MFYGIGTGAAPFGSIERDEIAQIYARSSRTKRPISGAPKAKGRPLRSSPAAIGEGPVAP